MSNKRKRKNKTAAHLQPHRQGGEEATQEKGVPPGIQGREYTGVAKRRNIALAGKAERVGATAPAGHEADDDPFWGIYRQYEDLQEPLFPFEWCWLQYYQCDTLAICVDVIANNCANPHQFVYDGDAKEKATPENKQIEASLKDFFSRCNEKHSWVRLAKKVRRSLGVVNCGFVEVIRGSKLERNVTGEWRIASNPPERMYYIPSPHMRATTLDDEEVPVDVMMPRDGKMVKIRIGRRFRRFARINPTTRELTWFKEFGDPRVLDSVTGEFVEDGKTDNPATEIWFFRENSEGQVYGTPKWLSVFWDVRGRNEAKWVNADHLEQGAIPPVVLTVSGGKLTERSKEELDKLPEEIRSPQFYNRIIWLQVEPDETMDLNQSSTGRIPTIKFEKLRDPHHEDFMFGNYLDSTEESIRRVHQLPPVLTGVTGDSTYASSYTSMEVAESQVFEPLRRDFDEKITVELIQNEFGYYHWSIRTGGSKIGDKETFYKAVGALYRAGALTINNVRELANHLLGTQFAPFDGDLYNEPITVVLALANQGLVGYNSGSQALEFLSTVGAIASTAEQAGNDFQKSAITGGGKSEIRKAAEAATETLVESLVQLAEISYEPPDEEAIEFELLPTGTNGDPSENPENTGNTN